MAQEKTAKVHRNHTQRATPRHSAERKVAFKGLLDNPHRVPWPSVSANIQNSILAHLVDLLDGVAEYHRTCCVNAQKKKRISTRQLTRKNSNESYPEGPSTLPDNAELSEPPILKSLTYGINAVTKRLESQIVNCRPIITLGSSNESQPTEKHHPIRYLFVCRADVDPPILIDHLPHLVAIYNVLRGSNAPPTALITLPKGAEGTLAQVIGVRRLAVLAIDNNSATANERLSTASTLPLVTAPWISSQPTRSFVQTHIKQLRTTAPQDMKAAKAARTRARSAAKARRSLQKRQGGAANKTL